MERHSVRTISRSSSTSDKLDTRRGGTSEYDSSGDDDDYGLNDFKDIVAPSIDPRMAGMVIPPSVKQKSDATRRLEHLAERFKRNEDTDRDNTDADEIMEVYPDLRETKAGKLIMEAQRSLDDVVTTDGEL